MIITVYDCVNNIVSRYENINDFVEGVNEVYLEDEELDFQQCVETVVAENFKVIFEGV